MQSERQTELSLQGIGRQPFILMRHAFLENMLTPIIKYLHAAGYPIVYMMGRESGVQEVRQIRDEQVTINSPLIKIEMLEKSLNRLSQMGWGKISLTQYNITDGGINIKIKFNPFTKECKEKTNASCTFLRGLIGGITSEILEQDMQFSDPICQATDDETCLLQLKATMR
jgi:predicted hydrocarbon binding protein